MLLRSSTSTRIVAYVEALHRQRFADCSQRAAAIEQAGQLVADRSAILLLHAVVQIEVVARGDVADQQREQQRAGERADRDRAEARFLREVILQVEVDADEAAVAALAVVDRRVPRQERAVLVALEVGIDVGLAGRDLLQPVGIRLHIELLERLHVLGRHQLVARLQLAPTPPRCRRRSSSARPARPSCRRRRSRDTRRGSAPAVPACAHTAPASCSRDRAAGGADRRRRRWPRAAPRRRRSSAAPPAAPASTALAGWRRWPPARWRRPG